MVNDMKKTLKTNYSGSLAIGVRSVKLVEQLGIYFVVVSQGTSRFETLKTRDIKLAEKWFEYHSNNK